MSDDHHYAGGHELEGVNAGNLFKIIFGLGLVTLLAATAVVQWFYVQREELTLQRAAEGSPFLAEYREKVGQDLQGIDRVAKKAAEDPSVLGPAPAPEGFIHPDGPAPAPAPALQPVPAPPDEGAAEGADGSAEKDGDGAKQDEPAEKNEGGKDEGAKKEKKGAEEKPAKDEGAKKEKKGAEKSPAKDEGAKEKKGAEKQEKKAKKDKKEEKDGE